MRNYASPPRQFRIAVSDADDAGALLLAIRPDTRIMSAMRSGSMLSNCQQVPSLEPKSKRSRDVAMSSVETRHRNMRVRDLASAAFQHAIVSQKDGSNPERLSQDLLPVSCLSHEMKLWIAFDRSLVSALYAALDAVEKVVGYRPVPRLPVW